jgi:4-amino-4-deoxy-L-arabinose transferase-like glycosyltransferase
VGHLWVIVGFMNLLGHAIIQNAAWASAAASMLVLLLIARIGLGSLNPWATAIALLFAACSPLDRAMARRVWGDELFAACALAALLAFIAWATGGRRARWMLLCLALAGYSVLVKENGLVVLGLATAGFAIVEARVSGARGALLAELAGVATLVATVAVLALACGGIEPLRATFARLAASHANEYMIKYQTGGPGYYVRGLLALQPVPILLGLLAAAVVAFRGPGLGAMWKAPRARTTLTVLTAFTLAFAGLALAWPQKNLRFLSPIYAPLDLLAGAGVWAALDWARGRWPSPAFRVGVALVAVALIVAAIADQQRFVELFIRRGIPDLATPWFTAGR